MKKSELGTLGSRFYALNSGAMKDDGMGRIDDGVVSTARNIPVNSLVRILTDDLTLTCPVTPKDWRTLIQRTHSHYLWRAPLPGDHSHSFLVNYQP